MSQGEGTRKSILVYDYGGGTLDLTVMVVDKTKESPEYDIVATDGDTCLGGEEFDGLLAEYCLDWLE